MEVLLEFEVVFAVIFEGLLEWGKVRGVDVGVLILSQSVKSIVK